VSAFVGNTDPLSSITPHHANPTMNNSSSTMTTHETSQLQFDVERLKGDLRQLRSDMGRLGSDARITAQDSVAAAREHLGETASREARSSRVVRMAAEEQIERHPLLAVGAALAVGAIAGAALGAVLARRA
jgi:ElaB/YqjD/DUF883 family membrane-anchored ribosome-binding protein